MTWVSVLHAVVVAGGTQVCIFGVVPVTVSQALPMMAAVASDEYPATRAGTVMTVAEEWVISRSSTSAAAVPVYSICCSAALFTVGTTARHGSWVKVVAAVPAATDSTP